MRTPLSRTCSTAWRSTSSSSYTPTTKCLLLSISMFLFRGGFHNTFYFGHVDHREKFSKRKEAGEEQTKREYILTDIIHGGIKHRPAGGQIIAVKRCHDDHKALEPHADIHDN